MAICTNGCPDVPGDCEDEPPPPAGCGDVPSTVEGMAWVVTLFSVTASMTAVGPDISFDMGVGGGQAQCDAEICNPLDSEMCLRITAICSWDSFPASAVPFSQIGITAFGASSDGTNDGGTFVSAGQSGAGSGGAVDQQFITHLALPAGTTTIVTVAAAQAVPDGSPQFDGTILVELVSCP